MKYLEKAYAQFPAVAARLYREKGIKSPSFQAVADAFKGLRSTKDLESRHVDLLVKRSHFWDPRKFGFTAAMLKGLREKRIDLVPDKTKGVDVEDKLIRKLMKRLGEIGRVSLLLRLVNPKRYPIFKGFAHGDFFPIHGQGAKESFLTFRDDLLGLIKTHNLKLNVAEAEHGLWALWMVRKKGWHEGRLWDDIWKEFCMDPFISRLRAERMPIRDIFFGSDVVRRGAFLEQYDAYREAGKFYGEALEGEVRRLYEARGGLAWDMAAKTFPLKVDEIRLGKDLGDLVKWAWVDRAYCVHPVSKRKPINAEREMVGRIHEAYRKLRELES
ncbi:MAG: hypothetical protein ABIJ96_09685 [Elusimicrobiota bacterium]